MSAYNLRSGLHILDEANTVKCKCKSVKRVACKFVFSRNRISVYLYEMADVPTLLCFTTKFVCEMRSNTHGCITAAKQLTRAAAVC